jgi:hypothetical protein
MLISDTSAQQNRGNKCHIRQDTATRLERRSSRAPGGYSTAMDLTLCPSTRLWPELG